MLRKTTVSVVLAALVAISATMAVAPGVPDPLDPYGPEFDILDAYLAQFDWGPTSAGALLEYAGVPYSGAGNSDPIPHADRSPANNLELLVHWQWHVARTPQMVAMVFKPAIARAIGLIDADPYGEDFLKFHRSFIEKYDQWRVANGHPPLAAWNPSGCIPDAYAYPGRVRECIDRPIPTWATLAGGITPDPVFGYYRLADFPTANRLGKALEGSGYHGIVHSDIGGDMAGNDASPKDPIFWAYHMAIDRAYRDWQGLPAHPMLPVGDEEQAKADLDAAMRALTPAEVQQLRLDTQHHLMCHSC